jgi:hypothetical protein
VHGCRANPDDVNEPPNTSASQREQLQDPSAGETQIEVVKTKEAEEQGQQEGCGLGLAMGAALRVGPVAIAFAKGGGMAVD